MTLMGVPKGHKWQGVYLAGGAVRTMLTNEPVVDFDLFFDSADTADRVEKYIATLKNANEIFRCQKGELITYQIRSFKIQLIKKTYHPNIEDLLARFDFTICKFGFDMGSQTLAYTRQDEYDLYNKILRINELQYPVATMHRVQKYLAKGYKPEDWQAFWADLITRSHGIELTDENLALYID